MDLNVVTFALYIYIYSLCGVGTMDMICKEQKILDLIFLIIFEVKLKQIEDFFTLVQSFQMWLPRHGPTRRALVHSDLCLFHRATCSTR